MYEILSLSFLTDVPNWAKLPPTTFQVEIADQIKQQLWPDVEYPPESAIAAVDSIMNPEQRLWDTDVDSDLKQIARILAQTLLTTPRTFDQWYQMLKTAWGWRIAEPKPCPDSYITDPVTKECVPTIRLMGERKTALFLIGGLVIGLILFRR